MGLIVLALAVVGCEEPPQIIQSAEPGMDRPRVLPVTEGEGAQAIGEQPRGLKTKIEPPPKKDIPPALPTAKGETKKTKGGVEYQTLKEGTGPEVKVGQKVTVHYTGTLEDGTKFDSSRDRGQPATFEIGTGQVIDGWDQAVPGMKVGERRRLKIPSNLGYGPAGRDNIPSNANLNFDIEVLDAR
jgi:FKBP-type peptidyl-prolyl cis-trans isomerase